jgi:RimJ/RimL family protein N-acetyltransferase
MVVGTEVLFVANNLTAPKKFEKSSGVEFEIRPIVAPEVLDEYAEAIDSAYFPGYVAAMKAPFAWGEQLLLATSDEKPVAFIWLQSGAQPASTTYLGPLLQNEGRLLRAGVLPEFRGKGIYTVMLRQVLSRLLEAGFGNVFIDCSRYNVPALRAHLAAGFRAVGIARVVRCLGRRPFVAWQSLRHAENLL